MADGAKEFGAQLKRDVPTTPCSACGAGPGAACADSAEGIHTDRMRSATVLPVGARLDSRS